MRHLSSVEFVDFIEGRLRDDRAAHVRECAACADHAHDLRAMIGDVRSIEAPEPSPLFWDHLSARIREAVAQEPVPRASWWSGWSADRLAVAGAAATVALIVTVMLGTQPWRDVRPENAGRVSPAALERPDGPAVEALADDPDWSLVVSVADGYDSDAAVDAGLQVADATTEDAVFDLSVDERRELARLLERELQPKS